MKSSPLFDRPSLHFRPRRYKPHGVGYWSGHIPFACDLIATLRPSVFVELGTHTGESFFAFCQAIQESGVQCRAVAVDTWRGDAHTGAYDDSVFQEVQAYARENYPSFTKLLRTTFDEASKTFGDSEIDLLHIDGLHAYDAVRHDFDAWWPKVKPGGVVLMHDSFDRHADFGVWRLLTELRTEFPVSEFFHSHGLGIVVKPGQQTADHVANEMVYAEDDHLRKLRRYYEVCAGNLEHDYQVTRQHGPVEWNVISQLFWRDSNAGFSEQASVRLAHIVTADTSEARLVLPSAATAYTEFRIDLTLEFALLELYAVRVLDKEEIELCRWEMPTGLLPLQAGGLHSILTEDEKGALVLNTPIGSQVRLPIPDSAKERLQDGGSFIVRMKGLNAYAFTQRMAAAYGASEARHRQTEEGLIQAMQLAQATAAERARRVNELEQSFIHRVVRRFR